MSDNTADQTQQISALRRPDGSEEDRLPPLLRVAWYSLNQAFRRRVARFDLTPDRFTVLRWLSEYEKWALTQRDIAELMASDANTIAALVSRMEEEDLVQRRVDQHDRRAKRVALTARGRRLLKSASGQAKDLQTSVLAAVPKGRRDRFLRDLRAVALAARRHADEEA